MKKFRLKYLVGFGLIISLFGTLSLKAQVSRSVFFLEQVPSSSVINPAFRPNCNFYINLPLISTFYIGFESPFSFDDLTNRWESGDSLYIDRETVLNRLNDKNNYFSFELYNEIGRAGFRVKNHFFHFSVAKVFNTKFSFEKDLIKLVLYGNANPELFGKHLEFDDTGLNMTSYHEMALGYSYRINEVLTIGTRLKYLNGDFNIWTERADFTLHTSDEPNYPITASSDIILHTSSTITSFNNMIRQIEGYKWFDFSGNHGYAVDIGFDLMPSEKVKISASVVDLGKINWNENVKTFRSEYPGLKYTFEGFDFEDFISGGSFTDTLQILDTLTNHFHLGTYHESYSSHLNPKLYLGSIWNLNKSNELGVLVRTDFAENHIQPSLTLNYTHKFGNFLALYANYSILNKNLANLGLGFVLKAGPVQLYLLNDMAYSLVVPGEARNYNVHFGVSFVFGKPHENTDLPAIDTNNQDSEQTH